MEREFGTEIPSISFVSIATGRYLDFWKNQIKSAWTHLDPAAPIEFVLLTDLGEITDSAIDEIFENTNWVLKVGYVPHQQWPFPTLFKFRHVLQNAELLRGKIVWHLDADMLFAGKNVEYDLIQFSRPGVMTFVAHPGYFRNFGKSKLFLYMSYPELILRDARSQFLEGGRGTWERNKLSFAYVEAKKRIEYVCGGSWGGDRETFLDFSEKLASRIDLDLKSEFIARFHDESHINWYRANHVCLVLDSSYCFENSYRHLTGLNRRIVAVNKSESSTWER
jgi:hypothetical protein